MDQFNQLFMALYSGDFHQGLLDLGLTEQQLEGMLPILFDAKKSKIQKQIDSLTSEIGEVEISEAAISVVPAEAVPAEAAIAEVADVI